MDKEQAVKAIKDTNKLEERDAVLRGAQQNMSSNMPLRVTSHKNETQCFVVPSRT